MAEPSSLPPQTKLVDDVLVPVPDEIFASLDKFQKSNWKNVRRLELTHCRPGEEQAQTALRLGATIAEGFVAVEAEDVSEVKDIGKAVLTLARALGVERSVLARSNSINGHAESGQWGAVRKEWSVVNSDVKKAMTKLESEHLELVSFGGWLRGTEVLTALVSQHYSREDAALLRQPAVLDYFGERLGKMSAKIKRNVVVAGSAETISKLRPLVGQTGAETIPESAVDEIRVIVAEVVNAIERKKR